MPESRLDAILTATRERIADLRARARELERRAAQSPEPRRFAPALVGPAVGVSAGGKRPFPWAWATSEGREPVSPWRAYRAAG